MATGILGRKVGMTQIYNESGQAVSVTVIQAGPCHVLQLRSPDRDGYEAVQLGFLDKRRPKGRRRSRSGQARRSERGHVTSKLESKNSQTRAKSGVELAAKAECEPKEFIRELRGPSAGLEVGQQVTVGCLAQVKAVDVTATSKGRGFSGVIKRHHFSGQRATHGVKKVHRHGGSSGMSADPAHVFKGKRMPGQHGNTRVTMRNLKVVRVDEVNNLLLVYGGVPGPNGGFVVIRETNKV